MENQPNTDIIAIWKGFGRIDQRNGLFESKCRIRIWQLHDKNIVLFSDLDKPDTGTSITNCSENLATLVHRDFKVSPQQTEWFQHYPRHNTSQATKEKEGIGEEVDKVSYSWDGRRFKSPRWRPSSREYLEEIVETSIGMEGYVNLAKYHFKVP